MNILIYLIQVILYTGIFWSIYRLFLVRSTSHSFSRCFLGLSVLLPFALPFIRWSAMTGSRKESAVTILLPEAVTSPAARLGNSFHGYLTIVVALYALVVLCLLVRLWRTHIRIRKALHAGDHTIDKGLRIYTNTGIGPGSYGRAIFLPDDCGDDQMLAHEAAHIRHGHYFDLLCLQLIKTLCWPNIFLYAVGRDLKLVHEYQADAAASGGNTHKYILRLLDEVFDSRQYSITHSFFHHPIKNRISMLQLTKSPLKNTGKMLLAFGITITIAAASVWLQSCNFKKSGSGELAVPKQVFTRAAEMPAFKGNLQEWLGSNIKYPESARETGKEGRVGVAFVVKDDGHIADATVTKSSGTKELDEEALRVVNSMPDWKPGKNNGEAVCIAYTLPISFRLN